MIIPPPVAGTVATELGKWLIPVLVKGAEEFFNNLNQQNQCTCPSSNEAEETQKAEEKVRSKNKSSIESEIISFQANIKQELQSKYGIGVELSRDKIEIFSTNDTFIEDIQNISKEIEDITQVISELEREKNENFS